MTGVCVFLGLVFVALFVHGIYVLREIHPAMLIYVVGAALTARVFWERAKKGNST
jgi:flagellar motor component MotA